MGFRDQLYEGQRSFRVGIFGTLAGILLESAFEFGIAMLSGASRRIIHVFAAVFLVHSLILLATRLAPIGLFGVFVVLIFYACDFAIHREGRIRIEKDR